MYSIYCHARQLLQVDPSVLWYHVPFHYLDLLNTTFLRVLLTDSRVRKWYFCMQIVLIGTEPYLEMTYVTDMAFCCFFSSVLLYFPIFNSFK